MDLNPEQKSVVDHVMGPLLVLAPAGSGKTALLALRIQAALKCGLLPQEMLCLTFTNLAARQLRARVEQGMPALAGKIWMGTFHGFCTSLLRMESGRVGLPGDFVIYDEEDSTELMERLMREHNLTRIVKPDSRTDKERYYTAAELLSLLEQAKALACGDGLSLAGFSGGIFPDERLSLLFEHYSRELSARHAFDFSDLIYYVRAVFYRHKELRDKWANRFQFIQVDEIQDTHLAEYSVIRTLAAAQNIAFYGDLDQSIYGWRGATPFRVRDGFLRDFEPTVYSLPVNYRATKMLIGAADSFAQRAYVRRCTRLVPAPSCSPGTPVVIHQVEDEELEGAWIGEQILKHMAASTCRFRNIAVLCRSNRKADELGNSLSRMAVPCITAEQYNFFRRQEIKDVMAFLRLLLNPYDISAAQRIVLRYVAGVGELGVRRIMKEGAPIGLRLSDFLREETFHHNDPFGAVLQAWESGRVLVVDTETTGLCPFEDDVIELAYLQLERGKISGEWDRLLQSAKGVGASVQVHHITDDMLREEGVEPAVALGELFEKIPGSIIVGHNVTYDLAMIQSQAKRLGQDMPPCIFADTYEMARRFIKAESFKLSALCSGLGLTTGTAHRALGDVHSTVGLLEFLIPELKKDEAKRRVLVSAFRDKFLEMAASLAQFRSAASVLRPPQLLKEMIEKLGLMTAFESEPKRQANLRRLMTLFEEHDFPTRSSLESLKAIVQFASLAKHLDQLSEKDDKVIVAPVHQSKGLEFDVVFIAGAVDGAMPHFYATDHEEEKRLFYVAMTRPKEALFISGYRSKITSSGMLIKKKMTPYIENISKAYVEYQQNGMEFVKSRPPDPVATALRQHVESSGFILKFRVMLLRIRRYTARWFW